MCSPHSPGCNRIATQLRYFEPECSTQTFGCAGVCGYQCAQQQLHKPRAATSTTVWGHNLNLKPFKLTNELFISEPYDAGVCGYQCAQQQLHKPRAAMSTTVWGQNLNPKPLKLTNEPFIGEPYDAGVCGDQCAQHQLHQPRTATSQRASGGGGRVVQGLARHCYGHQHAANLQPTV
jgi:hypothetical protein